MNSIDTMLTPQFFVYWTLFFCVFLSFSMIFGHGHGHAGHATGAAHHGFGHHGGSHGATHAHGERSSEPNLRFVSLRTVMAFLSGFGVGGYFAAINDARPWIRIGSGCLTGGLLAFVAYVALNWLYKNQTKPVSEDDYIGATGYVQVSIGANTDGKIYCTVRGAGSTLLARTIDGSGLPLNTTIRIVRMAGSTAIVEKTT